MQKFPVFEPLLYGNEWVHIKRALDDNQISGTSPVVRDFEKEFAHFCEVPYSVAAANGTAALHLALLALGVGPGDEVIVPNATIISNAIAVVLCGATPVFVDVDDKNWCLNPRNLARALTSRTVGVMTVHLFGVCADMDALSAFTQQHGLWLLEDAAQAQNARWKGKMLGSFGQISCYSFYANKLFTTGEGGAVNTTSAALEAKLYLLRNLAFDPEPSRRFIHTHLAHNYRISGMQAAMGLAQLENAEAIQKKRRDLMEYYQEAFRHAKGFSFPEPLKDCEPAFWMCALRLEEDVSISIADLQEKLEKVGVGSRRFFYPLNRQPALKGKHRQEDEWLPVSNQLFDRGIYLPSSSSLTWPEVKTICARFTAALHA